MCQVQDNIVQCKGCSITSISVGWRISTLLSLYEHVGPRKPWTPGVLDVGEYVETNVERGRNTQENTAVHLSALKTKPTLFADFDHATSSCINHLRPGCRQVETTQT